MVAAQLQILVVLSCISGIYCCKHEYLSVWSSTTMSTLTTISSFFLVKRTSRGPGMKFAASCISFASYHLPSCFKHIVQCRHAHRGFGSCCIESQWERRKGQSSMPNQRSASSQLEWHTYSSPCMPCSSWILLVPFPDILSAYKTRDGDINARKKGRVDCSFHTQRKFLVSLTWVMRSHK